MERWEAYEMLNIIREPSQRRLSPKMEQLANFILEGLADIQFEEQDAKEQELLDERD